MRKKSYKISAILLLFSMVFVLSGCGKQITLEDAVSKTKDVKSYSYSLNISMKANGLSQPVGELKGSVKSEDKNVQTTMEISTNGLRVPIMLKQIDNKGELFINTQGLLNQMLGLPNDVKYVYISSDELLNMAEANGVAGEGINIEAAKDSVKYNAAAMICVNDFLGIANKYVGDKKLITYKELDGKSKSDSGIFSMPLNQDNMKEILKNYMSDEKSYENMKNFVKLIDPKQAQAIEAEAKEEILKDIEETMFKESTILDFVIQVEDGYITKATISYTNNKSEFLIELKLSDFNNVKDLGIPSKDDDGVKNLNELNLQMPGMSGL